MEDGWSISSETIKEPDKNSLGFQIKALLDNGRHSLNGLPVELQQEHEDWEREFPNLTIIGTKIPVYQNALNEKQQLRMAVATQLVKMHLWPEMKRILEANSTGPFTTKNQQTRRPCHLPKINPRLL